MFGGSWRKPTFLRLRTRDSENRPRKLWRGETTTHIHTSRWRQTQWIEIRIKGRNLYRNGVWRKPWPDEAQRQAAAEEKHKRGARASAERRERKCGDEGMEFL
jgi:hypothetical protein